MDCVLRNQDCLTSVTARLPHLFLGKDVNVTPRARIHMDLSYIDPESRVPNYCLKAKHLKMVCNAFHRVDGAFITP